VTVAASRRSLLLGAGAAFLTGSRAAAAAPVSGLEILGASNGSTVVLVELLESGGLAAAAPGAGFRTWRTTDDLRAGIVSGKSRLFTTPCHVPANLAARGMPIRLLCLLGLGHLAVISADESVRSVADLAGKPILGFFRRDMPDLVFRAAVKMEGLDPDRDLGMTYVQTPTEAAQMLVAGLAQTAILPEPTATAAIRSAAGQGRVLHRALDLNEVWGRRLGRSRIPMAGLAIHQSLIDECPEILTALAAGLPKARDRVVADPARAAAIAERTLQMRAATFVEAFPHLGIDLVSARAAKSDLIAFYSELLALDPDSIGGRLPPDEYYLDL
jgi:NitT/TauT family transport system substrate-binding protein